MRTATAEKELKRRVVAAGVVAGKPTRVTAAAARTSARNVQRLAAEPATQFLITEALQPHRRKLESMAKRAIYAIDKALLAHKDDNADHVARLRAVERYGELMGMLQGGKPESQTTEGLPGMTWEEFTVMYARRVHVQADSVVEGQVVPAGR